MNKELKKLIIWIILLTAIIAGQPFVWKYVTSRATALQDSRTQEQQLVQVKKNLASVQEVSNIQTEQLANLADVFPTSNEVTKLLGRIEKQASGKGVVDLKFISIDEQSATISEQVSPLKPLVISMQTDGSANVLLNFLQALENSPELTVVNSWSLTEAFQVETGTTHQLVVSVIYLLR